MANSILTPNMNLPNPVPGVDTGPDYANNIESSLNIIDQHNHGPGSGVQINPNGININASLPFNNNAATSVASSQYTIQSAQPTALTAMYTFGTNGELYWNDGVGNKVKITSGGAINATSSGISSGTASASFVSGNLVVTQSAGVGAAIDAGAYILRYSGSYPTPTGNYILIEAPSSLSSGYSVTLPPSPPSSTSFLTMGTTGIVGESISTVNGITRPNLAAVGQQISASSGVFSTTSTSPVAVTNLSVTITTSGRPVMVFLQDDGNASGSSISLAPITSTIAYAEIQILRGSTTLTASSIENSGSGNFLAIPPGAIMFLDTPAAGTYTYSIKCFVSAGSGGIPLAINYISLVAYEL